MAPVQKFRPAGFDEPQQWGRDVRAKPTSVGGPGTYRWGNNPRRAELKGRKCETVAKGTMGSVLYRFPDTGELVVSSWRAAS